VGWIAACSDASPGFPIGRAEARRARTCCMATRNSDPCLSVSLCTFRAVPTRRSPWGRIAAACPCVSGFQYAGNQRTFSRLRGFPFDQRGKRDDARHQPVVALVHLSSRGWRGDSLPLFLELMHHLRGQFACGGMSREFIGRGEKETLERASPWCKNRGISVGSAAAYRKSPAGMNFPASSSRAMSNIVSPSRTVNGCWYTCPFASFQKTSRPVIAWSKSIRRLAVCASMPPHVNLKRQFAAHHSIISFQQDRQRIGATPHAARQTNTPSFEKALVRCSCRTTSTPQCTSNQHNQQQ